MVLACYFLLFICFDVDPDTPYGPMSGTRAGVMTRMAAIGAAPIFLDGSFFMNRRALFGSYFISLVWRGGLGLFLISIP